MTDRVLALVGCGDKKRNSRTKAKSLYESEYFSKKRQWAEGCDLWRILSAEHGLLHPSTEIAPYDTVISDLASGEVAEWAKDVVADLQPLLSDVDVVVVLAGEAYVVPLQKQLSSEVVLHWPFQGKRIGEQIVWMKENPPKDQSSLEEFT